MIRKIKNLILAAGAFLVLGVPLVAPMTVMAQSPDIKSGVCQGADQLQVTENPTTSCGSLDTSGANDPNALIRKIINILSVVVGIVAVIMIIIGGFRYITSGGSSEKVTSAKNTLLYAIIGLVIVALAQVIVRFVLRNTAGT